MSGTGPSPPGDGAEAKRRAGEVLSPVSEHLSSADWWDDDWISRTVNAVAEAFESACGRWRSLFMAAQRQFDESTRIMRDAARSAYDKKRAASLQTATSGPTVTSKLPRVRRA